MDSECIPHRTGPNCTMRFPGRMRQPILSTARSQRRNPTFHDYTSIRYSGFTTTAIAPPGPSNSLGMYLSLLLLPAMLKGLVEDVGYETIATTRRRCQAGDECGQRPAEHGNSMQATANAAANVLIGTSACVAPGRRAGEGTRRGGPRVDDPGGCGRGTAPITRKGMGKHLVG